MHTVTSFDGSALSLEEMSTLMADYLAVERARIWRRLLTTRFASLGALVVSTGMFFRWLPPAAYWITGGLCAMAPMWAWIVELRRDWRLTRRLEGIPGGATYVVRAQSSVEHHQSRDA